MLLKCERCGAPLEVSPGSAVRCGYCGTTAAVPAERVPSRGLPFQGSGSAPWPQQAPRSARGIRRSALGNLLLGGVTALAILGGVAASVLSRLSSTQSPTLRALSSVASPLRGRPVNGSPISWSSSPPGCLIDANGDGVFDVAGLTGASENNQATVVDGKSGQVLFTAPAVKKATQLGCLGEHGFFVVEANFQVDFFEARSPWGQTQVMARDKVSEYGAGTGCVQLRTDDGTTQGIELPGGAATTCPSKVLHRYHGERIPGMMGLTDSGTELVVGSRRYSLTQRASGTEILTLKVTENGRPVWSKELSYASCTFGAAIAVAPSTILLWAAEPADRNKGLLVGLDEATGAQLYELPIGDTSSSSPALFRYNGKYVLAVNWGALRAYEPATGAEAWRVGR